MSNRLSVTLAAFAGLFAFSGVGAAESPYHKNVSDVEVETAVKGTTYDKGPVNYFSELKSSGKKSDCCCVCPTPAAATTTTTTTTTAAPSNTGATNSTTTTKTPTPTEDGPRVKYILDGKPVYEDGAAATPNTPTSTPDAAPATAPASDKEKKTDAPKTTAVKADPSKLEMAIGQLGTASWKDAQVYLVQSGRAAVPYLIDALSSSESAYNLGGHTKADAGRAPRQRTVAEVAAELLTDIVSNHSNYNGDLPGADQAAWKEWWGKNGASVTFAGDVKVENTAEIAASH